MNWQELDVLVSFVQTGIYLTKLIQQIPQDSADSELKANVTELLNKLVLAPNLVPGGNVPEDANVSDAFKLTLRGICKRNRGSMRGRPYYCQLCDESVNAMCQWANHCSAKKHKSKIFRTSEFDCTTCGLFMLLKHNVINDYVHCIDHLLTDIIVSSRVGGADALEVVSTGPRIYNIRSSSSYGEEDGDEGVNIVCRSIQCPESVWSLFSYDFSYHESTLKWIIDQFPSVSPSDVTFSCTCCNTELFDELSKLVKHSKKGNHTNKIHPSKDELVLIFCHACFEFSLGCCREDVENHVSSERHMKNMTRFMLVTMLADQESASHSPISNLDLNHSTELVLRSEARSVLNLKEQRDAVLQKVDDTEGSIITDNFVRLLNTVKTKYTLDKYERGSTTAYYCGLCDVGCTVFSVFDLHVNSKKHTKRTSNTNQLIKIQCDKCGLFLEARRPSDQKYMSCPPHVELDSFLQSKSLELINLPTTKPPDENQRMFGINSPFIESIIRMGSRRSTAEHVLSEQLIDVIHESDSKTLKSDQLFFLNSDDDDTKVTKYLVWSRVSPDLIKSSSKDWYLMTGFSKNVLRSECSVCNVSYTTVHAGSYHVRSRKHRNNCDKSQDVALLCTFCCTLFVLVDMKSFVSHMAEERHVAAVKSILQIDRMAKSDAQAKPQLEETIWRAQNIVKNFTMEKKGHQQGLSYIVGVLHQVPDRKVNKDNLGVFSSNDVATEARLQDYANLKITVFYCLICESSIGEDISKLSGHIASRLHVIKSRAKEKSGENDSTCCWTCEVCSSLFIGIRDQLIECHMSSAKHFYNTACYLTPDNTFKLELNFDETFMISTSERYRKSILKLESCPLLTNVTLGRIEKYCSEYASRWDPLKAEFECFLCYEIGLMISGFSNWELHTKTRRHKDASYTPGSRVLASYCKPCRLCIIVSGKEQIKSHLNSHPHKVAVYKNTFGVEDDDEDNNEDQEREEATYDMSVGLTCRPVLASPLTIELMVESTMQEIRIASEKYESLAELLRQDLMKVLKLRYPRLAVHFFGSRFTGLAQSTSDIDVFVDIGNTFYGMFQMNKARIKTLHLLFHQNGKSLFKVRKLIADARVPIIKLEHTSTGVKCDVNTFDGSGVENSRLVKIYLSLDPRVFWLVVAVVQWASLNHIKGYRGFTSYGIIWMVLFFLMQPHVCLVPPVRLLMDMYIGPKALIGGWDYSFVTDIGIIRSHHNPEEKCSLTRMELLKMFFEFYLNLKTYETILGPLTGELFPRSMFDQGKVPAAYRALPDNKNSVDFIKMSNGIILLDPFVLRFNMLRSVKPLLLEHFKLLCQETLEMDWTQDPRHFK